MVIQDVSSRTPNRERRRTRDGVFHNYRPRMIRAARRGQSQTRVSSPRRRRERRASTERQPRDFHAGAPARQKYSRAARTDPAKP